MDPAKTVPATVRYELRIINGPYKFSIMGVIGDEWNTGSVEFLRLRSFLNDGGVIGLHRSLVC